MGSDGGNSGEFYTPRPLIKVITDVINPQIGQSIYDPAVGSCGFLIEAYNHIRYTDVQNNKQREISSDQLKFLNEDTFFGNEKTPLSYVMGVMNMILHGVESPNISKSNTLTKDIINSKSGDDLLDFVNKELFPYLKGFKSISENPKSIKYKIGAIFEFLDNRIANGHTLREVLDIIDEMDFHN